MPSPRVLAGIPWLGIAALYLPSMRNGFVYDDHEVILLQQAPRSLGEVAQIFAEPHGLPLSRLPYYRAVTRATLLVQKSLHGDAPAPFHAVNALLGGMASLLAFALLRRPCFGLAQGPAFAAAALFGVHPVMSACVHPIASGRETPLPAVLCLAALAAVIAGYLALRAAIFGVELQGAAEPPLAFQTMGPVLSALFALQSVFAPFVELRFGPLLASWWSPGRTGIACLLFAALVVLGTWRVDGSWRRRTIFWLGFSVVFLLPTANLVRQEAPYDERFVLLSSLGAAALVGGCLARVAAPRPRRLLFAIVAAAVVGLAAVSYGRGAFYLDALTFQRQWARTSASKANARFSYGTALLRAGESESARTELEAAVRLSPAHAEAHFNLAVALADRGELEQAAGHFQTVLRLDPADSEARANLDALAGLLRERAGAAHAPRSAE